MNAAMLVEAIRSKLETIVSEMRIPVETDPAGLRKPKIVSGYLPPKRTSEEPDFPFIIVRPAKLRAGQDGMTTVEVKLIVGCFSEEFDGYLYAVNVISEIFRELSERPTIDSVFRMELPFEWTLYDDQPYPEWQLDAVTRWTIATPQEIFDEGDI